MIFIDVSQGTQEWQGLLNTLQLGIDVYIPKAALKLLLDVLLAPDLQEQLSFRIAPYAALFRHLFSHVLGRLTTRLCNLAAESQYNPPELGSDNPDSIRIKSQLNPDSPAHVNGTIRIRSAM